jgi:hypothetical protein
VPTVVGRTSFNSSSITGQTTRVLSAQAAYPEVAMQQFLVTFAAEIVATALIALITSVVRRWLTPQAVPAVRPVATRARVVND